MAASEQTDLSSNLIDDRKEISYVSGNANRSNSGVMSGWSSNAMSISYNSLRGKEQTKDGVDVINASRLEARRSAMVDEERQPLLNNSLSRNAPHTHCGHDNSQSIPNRPQTEPEERASTETDLLSSPAPKRYNPRRKPGTPQSEHEHYDNNPLSPNGSQDPVKEGNQPSETSTSSKRNHGLKLLIPPAPSGNLSGTPYLNQRALGKNKTQGTKGRKSFHWHPSIANLDSSINDDYSIYRSGRRSAPVFSRRHYSGTLRPFGDRGSNQSLVNVGNPTHRKLVTSEKERSGPEPVCNTTKSYGSVQTHLSIPDDHRNEDTRYVFSSKQTSCTPPHTPTFDKMSREDLNEPVGLGYWSEVDSEYLRPRMVISQPFHQRDLPKSPVPHGYETETCLSNENFLEDHDYNERVQTPLSISQYLGQIRRCKSETPQTVGFSYRNEQIAFDGRSKSPLINDGDNHYEGKLSPHLIDDDGEKDDEKTPLFRSDKRKESEDDDSEVEIGKYARRWYMLLLFSMYCLIWNAIWSTWGPIAQSAKAVFDWSDATIAMFTWLGNIPFLVTMFPMAYLMDVKGMRSAMLLSCGLSFLGASLRCVTSSPDTATWLISTGQLLNGIAGTVPVSGAALVSGLWFPQNQRATATGISTIMGYLGVCVSFVTGPLVVPEPDFSDPANTTGLGKAVYAGDLDLRLTDSNNSSNGTDFTVQRDGIMSLLYYECGAMGLIFLLTLIYFPSKPPLPPSVSASVPRESYTKGLKMLIRHKQFWLTAVAFSVPIGVYEVWQIVLDVNLDPKVSQETAGWMDFYATLGGCGAGLLVSRFADLFTRQMKLFLVVFYTLAAVASLWFTLLAVDILPFDMVSIYAATVVCGVFLDGAAPLFFELVIEVSYPVGEGVTSGFLQMLCSSAGIVFLSLMQLESLGKSWMNWCLCGCISASIPFLLFIQSPLGRADIDDGLTISESSPKDDIKQETQIDRTQNI